MKQTGISQVEEINKAGISQVKEININVGAIQLNPNSQTSSLSRSSPIITDSLDVSEGVKVLKKALLDNGPLPVKRLVGYLANVKRSVREAVGKNQEELLRFLIADDRFKVEGSENIVGLKTSHKSSKLSSKKSVTEAQSQPILSPIVTNANLVQDPNPVSNSSQSPSQIQMSPNQIQINQGVEFLLNILAVKGPLPLMNLVGYLGNTSKTIRDTVGSNSAGLLEFLHRNNSFTITGKDNTVAIRSKILNVDEGTKAMAHTNSPVSSEPRPEECSNEAQNNSRVLEPVISTLINEKVKVVTPNSYVKNILSSSPVNIHAKNEKIGMNFLLKILSVNGPMPLHRLTGYLGSTDESIRGTIGCTRCTSSNLLAFLNRNDIFEVNEKDNIVAIRSSKSSALKEAEHAVKLKTSTCTASSMAVPEMRSIVAQPLNVSSAAISASVNDKSGPNICQIVRNVNIGVKGEGDIVSVKQKEPVAVKPEAIATVKPMVIEPLLLPENSKQIVPPSKKMEPLVAVQYPDVKKKIVQPLLENISLKSTVKPVLVTSKDIVGQNLSTPLLSSIDLAKLAVIRVFTKALQKSGPQKYSSLLDNLNETTENVRAAMRQSNTSYLDFLRSDNHFRVVEHIEPNKCIIYLISQWPHQDASTTEKTDQGCEPLKTSYERQRPVEINIEIQPKPTVMSQKVTIETSDAKRTVDAAVTNTTTKSRSGVTNSASACTSPNDVHSSNASISSTDTCTASNKTLSKISSEKERAEKQGVQHLKKVLSKRSPMTVDSLHGYLSLSGTAMREALGRNPKGLLQFLRNNKHFVVETDTNMVRLNTDQGTSLKEPKDNCSTFSNVDKVQNIPVSTATNSVESSNASKVSTVIATNDSKFMQFPEPKLSSDILASNLKHNQLPVLQLSSDLPASNPYFQELSTTNKCSNTPTCQLNSSELSAVKLSPVSLALNTTSSPIPITECSTYSTISNLNTPTCKLNPSQISATKLSPVAPLTNLASTPISITKCSTDSSISYSKSGKCLPTDLSSETTECNLKSSGMRSEVQLNNVSKWIANFTHSCTTILSTDNSPQNYKVNSLSTTTFSSDASAPNLISTHSPTAKLQHETSDPILPGIEFLYKLLSGTKSMPIKTLKFILLSSRKPICDIFGKDACLLVDFLHGNKDFVIEENDQIVRLKTNLREMSGSSAPVLVAQVATEDVRHISGSSDVSEAVVQDFDAFEAIILKQLTNMILRFGPMSIKKLELLLVDDKDSKQSTLPEALAILNAEVYEDVHSYAMVEDFLLIHNEIFAIVNDVAFLVNSKEHLRALHEQSVTDTSKQEKLNSSQSSNYSENILPKVICTEKIEQGGQVARSDEVLVTTDGFSLKYKSPKEFLDTSSSSSSSTLTISSLDFCSIESLVLKCLTNVISKFGPISIDKLEPMILIDKDSRQSTLPKLLGILSGVKDYKSESRKLINDFVSLHGDLFENINNCIYLAQSKKCVSSLTQLSGVKNTPQRQSEVQSMKLKIRSNVSFPSFMHSVEDITDDGQQRSSALNNLDPGVLITNSSNLSAAESLVFKHILNMISNNGPISIDELESMRIGEKNAKQLTLLEVLASLKDDNSLSLPNHQLINDFIIRYNYIFATVNERVYLVHSREYLAALENSTVNFEMKNASSLSSSSRKTFFPKSHLDTCAGVGKSNDISFDFPTPAHINTKSVNVLKEENSTCEENINSSIESAAVKFIIKMFQFGEPVTLQLLREHEHKASLEVQQLFGKTSDHDSFKKEKLEQFYERHLDIFILSKNWMIFLVDSSKAGQKLMSKVDSNSVKHNVLGEETNTKPKKSAASIRLAALKFIIEMFQFGEPVTMSFLRKHESNASFEVQQLFGKTSKSNHFKKRKLEQFCERHRDILRYSKSFTLYLLDSSKAGSDGTSKNDSISVQHNVNVSLDSGSDELQTLCVIMDLIKYNGPIRIKSLNPLQLGEKQFNSQMNASLDDHTHLTENQDVDPLAAKIVNDFILNHSDKLALHEGQVYLVNSEQYASLLIPEQRHISQNTSKMDIFPEREIRWDQGVKDECKRRNRVVEGKRESLRQYVDECERSVQNAEKYESRKQTVEEYKNSDHNFWEGERSDTHSEQYVGKFENLKQNVEEEYKNSDRNSDDECGSSEQHVQECESSEQARKEESEISEQIVEEYESTEQNVQDCESTEENVEDCESIELQEEECLNSEQHVEDKGNISDKYIEEESFDTEQTVEEYSESSSHYIEEESVSSGQNTEEDRDSSEQYVEAEYESSEQCSNIEEDCEQLKVEVANDNYSDRLSSIHHQDVNISPETEALHYIILKLILSKGSLSFTGLRNRLNSSSPMVQHYFGKTSKATSVKRKLIKKFFERHLDVFNVTPKLDVSLAKPYHVLFPQTTLFNELETGKTSSAGLELSMLDEEMQEFHSLSNDHLEYFSFASNEQIGQDAWERFIGSKEFIPTISATFNYNSIATNIEHSDISVGDVLVPQENEENSLVSLDNQNRALDHKDLFLPADQLSVSKGSNADLFIPANQLTPSIRIDEDVFLPANQLSPSIRSNGDLFLSANQLFKPIRSDEDLFLSANHLSPSMRSSAAPDTLTPCITTPYVLFEAKEYHEAISGVEQSPQLIRSEQVCNAPNVENRLVRTAKVEPATDDMMMANTNTTNGIHTESSYLSETETPRSRSATAALAVGAGLAAGAMFAATLAMKGFHIWRKHK